MLKRAANKKFLILLYLLIFLSGCSSFNHAIKPDERFSRFEYLEKIRKKMESSKHLINSHYKKALELNPVLDGSYLFEIVITPQGIVKDFKVLKNELDDKELSRSIEREIKALNFGYIKNTDTDIEYEFLFLSGGQ